MYDSFTLRYPHHELFVERTFEDDPWTWMVFDREDRLLGSSSEDVVLNNFMEAVLEGSAFVKQQME
jgi:hypothetical protein